jgi:hypothetical protein
MSVQKASTLASYRTKFTCYTYNAFQDLPEFDRIIALGNDVQLSIKPTWVMNRGSQRSSLMNLNSDKAISLNCPKKKLQLKRSTEIASWCYYIYNYCNSSTVKCASTGSEPNAAAPIIFILSGCFSKHCYYTFRMTTLSEWPSWQ